MCRLVLVKYRMDNGYEYRLPRNVLCLQVCAIHSGYRSMCSTNIRHSVSCVALRYYCEVRHT